jgi:acyl-CoA synthetase (AMP-forming)/AMP-acid ligase II
VLYIHDRWKGENVSTAEVESVIINVIGLKDTAVYGVQVNTVLNFILVIHIVPYLGV